MRGRGLLVTSDRGLIDPFPFSQLHTVAFIVGACWLALGVVILAIATRGFRRPVPTLEEEVDEASGDMPESVKAPV